MRSSATGSPIASPPTAYQLRQEQALNLLHEQLRARGFRGLHLFLRSIKRAEFGVDVSLVQFERVLLEHRLNIRREDAVVIYNLYDTRQRGLMDAEKFGASFQVKLSDLATNLVGAAFDRFRRVNNMAAAYEARALYAPENHPDVIAGRRSQIEVMLDFLESFDFQGDFTRLDFCRYYQLVRFAYYTDKDFCEMLAAIWSLDMNKLQPLPSILSTPPNSAGERIYPMQEMPISNYGTGPTSSVNVPVRNLTSMEQRDVMSNRNVLPSTSTTYNPSTQFSYSSPVSIGMHNYDDHRPIMTIPTQPYMINGNNSCDSTRIHNIICTLRAHFNGLRNLTQLRRALFYASQGSRYAHDQVIASVLEKFTYIDHTDCLDLLSTYRKDGNEFISIVDFVASLRLRNLNVRRLALIQQAYDKLDPNGIGEVAVSTVARFYHSCTSKDVLAGRYEPASGLPPGITVSNRDTITKEDFSEYYADVGSGIEDDNYFVLMVWNEWNLSDMAGMGRAALLHKRNITG